VFRPSAEKVARAVGTVFAMTKLVGICIAYDPKDSLRDLCGTAPGRSSARKDWPGPPGSATSQVQTAESSQNDFWPMRSSTIPLKLPIWGSPQVATSDEEAGSITPLVKLSDTRVLVRRTLPVPRSFASFGSKVPGKTEPAW